MPTPGELRMVQSHLPRDAYFGSVEDVPLDRAEGRVAAERGPDGYRRPTAWPGAGGTALASAHAITPQP